MTTALEGGEWSAARPGRTLPPGKTRYPFYRRLGWPQGRSGRAENLVPTGIRSRTVQSVAQSLYRLSYRAHLHTHTHTFIYIYIYIYRKRERDWVCAGDSVLHDAMQQLLFDILIVAQLAKRIPVFPSTKLFPLFNR